MNITFIPEERLRIFISSAQNNENGFAWTDTRKRIKEYLKECPYLNPFIIEDAASSLPSIQLFQRQVEKADVVVLLVKGEVRQGTAMEYALATRCKKPLLVYFLEDEMPSLSVVQLKNDLQASDYCTYYPMKNFDSVEIAIRNDIIEDVIRYYQDMPYHHDSLDSVAENLTMSKEVEPLKLGTPNKTTIAMFSSCYNHIFDLLGMSYDKTNIVDESILHSLGEKMLDWLVTGQPFKCDSNILKLIECTADIYENTDWLLKRWDAIRYEMSGDISMALTAEQKALDLAKNTNAPKWIINDILIDCRNMEMEVNQLERRFWIEGEAQKEINLSDTIVYLPVLDRYVGNIYDDIASEEFRIDTASHNTILCGTNVRSAISNVEHYFFSAMLYGSYTHLMITRKLLAHTLYKYAEMTNNTNMLFESLKLYVLKGDAKNYKLFLNQQWDKVYSFVTSYADNIWLLAEKAPYVNRNLMKQAIFETLGLYLSDTVYLDAEKYILDIEKDVYWGNSQSYFECIYPNINRINQDKLVNALSTIIADKRFHIGSQISNIILQLNLDSVTLENKIKLKDSLLKELPFVVKNGGSPQIIAALIRHSQEIFGVLETLPDNGLIGIEEQYYKINMGSDNWVPILEDAIAMAVSQFEANKKQGVYSEFFTEPYSVISKIVRESDKTTMHIIESVLSEQFIPLAIEVLNSEVAVATKESCTACLCDVLSFFVYHNIKISPLIIDSLQNTDIGKGTEFSLTKSREMLSNRLFMAKLIVGISDKNDLLQWCIGYGKKSVNERIVLADCIEKYLFRHNEEHSNIDLMLLSFIIQCIEDEQYEIRCLACRCLNYILHGQYNSIAESKLYQAAFDPSHYVRNNLLHMCKEGKIEGEISAKLIDIFAHDANYAIREYACS